MGQGGEKGGLKAAFRFLDWANECMVMQFSENINPREGVSWGIWFCTSL
jgi:hypothetical protein